MLIIYGVIEKDRGKRGVLWIEGMFTLTGFDRLCVRRHLITMLCMLKLWRKKGLVLFFAAHMLQFVLIYDRLYPSRRIIILFILWVSRLCLFWWNLTTQVSFHFRDYQNNLLIKSSNSIKLIRYNNNNKLIGIEGSNTDKKTEEKHRKASLQNK